MIIVYLWYVHLHGIFRCPISIIHVDQGACWPAVAHNPALCHPSSASRNASPPGLWSRASWVEHGNHVEVSYGGTPIAGGFIKQIPTKIDDFFLDPYFWKPPSEVFNHPFFGEATWHPILQTHPDSDSVQRQICEKPVVLSVTLPQHPLATHAILKNVLTKSRSQGVRRYNRPW